MLSDNEEFFSQCPCCKACEECSDSNKFVKIFGTNLVMYGQTSHNQVNSKMKPTIDDIVKLENSRDQKFTRFGSMSVPELQDIYCPRCKYFVARAKKMLETGKIDSNFAIGICAHCRQKSRPQIPCYECEDIAREFVSKVSEESDNSKQKLHSWLEKVKHLLKYTREDEEKADKKKEGLIHSELHPPSTQRTTYNLQSVKEAKVMISSKQKSYITGDDKELKSKQDVKNIYRTRSFDSYLQNLSNISGVKDTSAKFGKKYGSKDAHILSPGMPDYVSDYARGTQYVHIPDRTVSRGLSRLRDYESHYLPDKKYRPRADRVASPDEPDYDLQYPLDKQHETIPDRIISTSLHDYDVQYPSDKKEMPKLDRVTSRGVRDYNVQYPSDKKYIFKSDRIISSDVYSYDPTGKKNITKSDRRTLGDDRQEYESYYPSDKKYGSETDSRTGRAVRKYDFQYRDHEYISQKRIMSSLESLDKLIHEEYLKQTMPDLKPEKNQGIKHVKKHLKSVGITLGDKLIYKSPIRRSRSDTSILDDREISAPGSLKSVTDLLKGRKLKILKSHDDIEYLLSSTIPRKKTYEKNKDVDAASSYRSSNKKFPSKEILSTPVSSRSEPQLRKDFSYQFLKEIIVKKEPIRQRTSAELIKETQEMLNMREEEKQQRLEIERVKRRHDEEIKKQAREEKKKLQEEKRQEQEQLKRIAERERKIAEEENRRLEEERKREQEKLKALENKKKKEEKLSAKVDLKKKYVEKLTAKDEVNKSDLEKLTTKDDVKKKDLEKLTAKDGVKKRDVEKLNAKDDVKKKDVEKLSAKDDVKKRDVEKLTAKDDVKKKHEEKISAKDEAKKKEEEKLSAKVTEKKKEINLKNQELQDIQNKERAKEEKERAKEERERIKQEKESAKEEKEKAKAEKEREKEKEKEEKKKAEEAKRRDNEVREKTKMEKVDKEKEKEKYDKEAEKNKKQKEKEYEAKMHKEEKQREKDEKDRLKKEREDKLHDEKEQKQREKEYEQKIKQSLEAQKKEIKVEKTDAKEQKPQKGITDKKQKDVKNGVKQDLAKETPAKELDIKRIKMRKPSFDDLILRLVKLKQSQPTGKVRGDKLRRELPILVLEHQKHKYQKESECLICQNSEIELDIESILMKADRIEPTITDIIIGKKILKHKPLMVDKEDKPEVIPALFQTTFDALSPCVTDKYSETLSSVETASRQPIVVSRKYQKQVEQEAPKGIIRYALSDRAFIDKGWTMLPTEKVVRKMNVYRMRPAHPEFDWFERNKKKKIMLYDTGEKLAEFDDNGRSRIYYKNGRLALDYYDAEEVNAQQRFVVFSSGELDERGRSHPITILATFDYLGNGIVFDYGGKIRLKYNQTEGVVLDRGIGPVSNWKWHTLNDPPVLQKVMIDTQMAHKDPDIYRMGGVADNKSRPDNEEMLAIEFDNFIKEKSKKLTQTFKPFQIKMKALKINEHFSLKILDQATIYLIFRDSTTNLKLNLGMILDHKEIVDTDTAEVGEVSNSLERFPARTESLAGLQRSVAYAQRFERTRLERERRLRPPEPCTSADQLTAAASRPLRPPLRSVPSASTAASTSCKCSRKPCSSNVYYDTRLI